MKNNIKERRKARGLRQEDMAKLLGVSRQTIVAMENDKYDPTLELAIKTARLLEQPVESIFFLDEESWKLRIENGEWSAKAYLDSGRPMAAPAGTRLQMVRKMQSLRSFSILYYCMKKGLPAGSPFLQHGFTQYRPG